jgi:uncharacterized protein
MEIRHKQLSSIVMKKISIFKSTVQLVLVAVIIVLFMRCEDSTKLQALVVADSEEVGTGLGTILENSGLFSAKVISNNPSNFKKYDVVVVDVATGDWDDNTKTAFAEYVKNGGASVLVGASAVAFGDWADMTEIAGTPAGAGLVKSSEAFEYSVRNLKKDHPITAGLQPNWMHSTDYLSFNTSMITGQTEVLATAWADTTHGGDGAHLPVMAAINYGQGRVFHTTLGINASATDLTPLLCVGFITILQRGAEWAATGVVSQAAPIDFPNAVSTHEWPEYKPLTLDQVLEKAATYEVGKSTKYLQDFTMMVRKSDGSPETYGMYEDKILAFLASPASAESKKYMCRELSWMGTEKSVATLEGLTADPELGDAAKYALARLKP